ncbi:efflux RND transporter periplasmic adaptor subunit [Engelhardtia mirabilis]|uniref:Multidrug resistance protein MdtA n=1 Tax=Engelhardtia mirabilis TaxID=2528011 RepID=A0A518BHN0_9BACT|nr:Multidrug resistance protein MdtA precursor [Planctomycetes bacterium Pla133]QDV00791.1 Multidrug resistance protein MdtA precursor [Planctomycetes bacterium Pla86]
MTHASLAQEPRPSSSAPVDREADSRDLPSPPRYAAWIASLLLLAVIVGGGLGLTAWRRGQMAAAAAVQQPEPVAVVTADLARILPYQRTSTAIGTVLALRSVTLRNEVAGTVVESRLEAGAIVEEGELLVALDVSVEQAELAALEARAALAATLLDRTERASASRGASQADVDRARTEREVADADVARTKAEIRRKTLRAPFRARIGLSDVHTGQYLDQGASLTTLQGADDAVHVDFSVPQDTAAGLLVGQQVSVVAGPTESLVEARIVAIDARVDRSTRNSLVRARIEGTPAAPGSSVRVRVPLGPPRDVLTVPVSALRRSPAGDLVFVLVDDGQGATRAHERRVDAGAVLGDAVVIESGLVADERVAVIGSFKLYEGARVDVAQQSPAAGASAAN